MNLSALPPAQLQDVYTELTHEEHDTVIEKMIGISQQPAGHLPRQEELYLEQQLTDWFGFEIVAELEGTRLPHSIGTMASAPHLRRHPTDVLVDHGRCHHAGFKPTRSGFGWFTELGQLTPTGIAQEMYYFGVDAQFISGWQGSPLLLKNWLKFRKMIMINPSEERAVIGCIGDFAPAEWMQHQFSGSPEVIQDGKVWSPRSRGRVLLFFINDPMNQVQLGPLDLRYDSD